MNAEFFERFGFLVFKNFFGQEECIRLRNEIQATQRFAATVREKGGLVVDEETRRTKQHKVSDETIVAVHHRLLALKPKFEQVFGLTLKGCQQPQFLSYQSGDFYLRHRDVPSNRQVAPAPNERQVSVVIFLNDQSEEPAEGSYCGGSLTFYGILDDPRLEKYGFPLNADAGLLIAFPSNVIHEVQPVTEGKRYSIVCWFY